MRTATDPAHTKRHCLLPNIKGALHKRCSCQRAYSQSSSACGISRVLAQSLFSGFDAHQLRAIGKSKKNIFSSWSKSHAPRFPPLLMVLMHLFDIIRTQWLHGQTGRTLRTPDCVSPCAVMGTGFFSLFVVSFLSLTSAAASAGSTVTERRVLKHLRRCTHTQHASTKLHCTPTLPKHLSCPPTVHPEHLPGLV